MIRYIIKRLLMIIPNLIGITLLAFILGHISSSDPALVALTMDGSTVPTLHDIAMKRQELGLNDPIYIQYGRWAWGILQGNWGNSYITGLSVFSQLIAAAKVTLSLACVSFIIVVAVSIPLGVVMAINARKKIDYFLQFISMLLTAVPSFWIALVAIQVFSENLRWFPTSGYGDVWHLILPASVVGLGSIGLIMRLQRDSLYSTLQNNYILTARSKGLQEWYVIYHHGLRNACIPIITQLGNYLIGILGGTAIIEIIFGLPGLGSLVLESIKLRDYPMVQGYVLMVGIITILINLGIDIVYLFLQPKARYGHEEK